MYAVKCDFLIKRNFPDHFSALVLDGREGWPLRHHRTYSSVSSLSRRLNENRRKKKNPRRRCKRKLSEKESQSMVLENRKERIFLDMSSHCVTNIWEWSRGILSESCLIFPPNGEADVAENLNIGVNKTLGWMKFSCAIGKYLLGDAVSASGEWDDDVDTEKSRFSWKFSPRNRNWVIFHYCENFLLASINTW